MSLSTSLQDIRDSLESILKDCNNALFPKGAPHVDCLSELPGVISGIHTNIKLTVTEEYPGMSCGLSMESARENIASMVEPPIRNVISQQYSGLSTGLCMNTLTETISTSNETITEGE